MKTLTDFLKEIGEEEVTICFDGKPITCTKTEAAARKLYLMANGGVEETKDETGAIVRIFHKGDPRLCKMIREYTEGKPAPEAQSERGKGKKAGTFNSKIGKRLNEQLNLGPSRPKIPVKKDKGEQ